jgi:ABC-type polysaccharide/polyol phosphate transport system ATPase subunit/SAM-dependent methyltransferase
MKAGSLSGPETSLAATEARDELRPLAIRATGLSKTFRIPHEARYTVRDYALHPFRRTTYETQRALADVSFEIAQGEFFGVIGRNGSGKSTLLKVVAGIYPPDTGTVEIGGKLSPFIELGVGFNPELSARDNVGINGTLLGLSPKEIEERFDDIIAFGELERFVDQKLKNFSSGMQLRLAYSIAIQVPFDILLLDEVLAVGDQNFQEKCFATFEQMRESGKTVVLVTHDLRSVARFCERALLLRDGIVQALGTPQDVTEIYLEQERARSTAPGNGRLAVASQPHPSVAEAPPASEDEVREAEMRLIERRWHGIGTDDIAFLNREDVVEIITTQQKYLEERHIRVDRLLKERHEMWRENVQLGQMVDVFLQRHYREFPLPPETLRAGKRLSRVNFLTQGLVDAEHILTTFGDSPTDVVLEWGCGAGRTARWLASYPNWADCYRGCDNDAAAVTWVRANLGLDARVSQEKPPLPYEDAELGGVFTLYRMSSYPGGEHRHWYEEIRRVLRPGSYAYVTLQGRAVLEGRSEEAALTPLLDRQGWATVGSGEQSSVTFVTEEFVREATEGLFFLERFEPTGHKLMDRYLLKALD